MLHKGSLLVTGTSTVIIPLRRRPGQIDSWFDASCDITLPHTCSVICDNDRLISKVIVIEPYNNLGPRMWGLQLKWQIFDHRTRQIYWTADMDGCNSDDMITDHDNESDYILNKDNI